MEAFAKPLLDFRLPHPAGLRVWNGSDPKVRYAVYRNNVIVSLIEALADTFPVVRQLVGEAFFRAMAHTHILQNPPASPVLAHYGLGFADFIAAFEPASPLPYLADVARLEWAYVEAFYAADAPCLTEAAYADLLTRPGDLAAMRLAFIPSTRLTQSEFSVLSLWHAHVTGGDLSSIDLTRPEAAIIVRPVLEVRIIPIGLRAADLVRDSMAGRSLAEACERQAADVPRVASMLYQLLRTESLKAFEPVAQSEGNPDALE